VTFIENLVVFIFVSGASPTAPQLHINKL